MNNSHSAFAHIKGSYNYPDLRGNVYFNETQRGIMVTAEVFGLPVQNKMCGEGFFAFHIHEGSSCTGNSEDPFADVKFHYNPGNCPHPYHAGDLPPLLSNNGHAYMTVLTDRFSLDEIIGRTIVIHENADDFTTQPSGNSGAKIACGEISGG